MWISDAMLHRTIRKMFPEAWLADTALPVLEGLVNQPELTHWRR